MLTMVSEFVLGQTQMTPQDHFLQATKTYTKSSIVNFLIRYSSGDSTKQTNPEKYNRHTQHIMNLATQLAMKELLKSKRLVHQHLKQYLIQKFSTQSRKQQDQGRRRGLQNLHNTGERTPSWWEFLNS